MDWIPVVEIGQLVAPNLALWLSVGSRIVTYPHAPCMEYLPLFTYIHPKNDPNVGEYSIHGAYGITNLRTRSNAPVDGREVPLESWQPELTESVAFFLARCVMHAQFNKLCT